MNQALNPVPSYNILVVDDEADIRRTLTICLEAEGYQVRCASGPAQALVEASKSTFDAVFLDLRLGTRSGMDLIPALLDIDPGLKIVMITAYATVSNAVEALKKGAFDYLAKPFLPVQVLDGVRKALAARRQEEVLSSQAAAALLGFSRSGNLKKLKDPGPMDGVVESLEAVEEAQIRRVLAMNRPLEESAKILGIDIATLWRKRKKYKIKNDLP
ncbi:MAG: response regulator [candidate division FCPU426 bacterium]